MIGANQYKAEIVSEWRNVLNTPANIALLLQQLTVLVDLAKGEALADRDKSCGGHDDDCYPWQLPPKAFCPYCGLRLPNATEMG